MNRASRHGYAGSATLILFALVLLAAALPQERTPRTHETTPCPFPISRHALLATCSGFRPDIPPGAVDDRPYGLR